MSLAQVKLNKAKILKKSLEQELASLDSSASAEDGAKEVYDFIVKTKEPITDAESNPWIDDPICCGCIIC